MSLILILLIVAIILIAYNKTIQRYILLHIIKWITKKSSQQMGNAFNNNYRDETQQTQRDETQSKNPSGKMSVKDMVKKKFGQKKDSQYVDYEEIE